MEGDSGLRRRPVGKSEGADTFALRAHSLCLNILLVFNQVLVENLRFQAVVTESRFLHLAKGSTV